MDTDKTSNCDRCGRAKQGQEIGGLCASCLIESVLESESETVGLPEDKAGLNKAGLDEKGLIGSRVFGGYELIELIGRGGMGIVYKARQTKLNRMVALKMVQNWQDASADMRARFGIEAEAAAKLDHPNIVPTYEISELNGQPYFSMRLVEGSNLAAEQAKLRREKPDSKGESKNGGRTDREAQVRIAEVMAKVARAIHFAHQSGVIHRDLKPNNILIDLEGEPHITDFGLAKLLEDDQGLTRTNELLGTPAYMAPEQACGKGVTAAVDIYSLGAILYELLTGRPPFRGKTPLETLRKAVDEEPLSPVTINSNADLELTAICLKCLEKNRMHRYESAQGLAEDLERWIRREPILAKRSSIISRGIRWMRRNPVGATLIATLCIALLGTLILLRMVSVEKNKNVAALLEVDRAGQASAQLLSITVSLLNEQLDGLWRNTDRRVLNISAEQLAPLSGEEITPVKNKSSIERFSFGLAANESPVADAQKYSALLRYLQNRLTERRGHPVRIDLKIYKFKEDRVAALLNGEVDFARVGGIFYLQTKRTHPEIRGLVLAETRAKTAVFFTRTNSAIQKLSDLPGHRVAFGDSSAGITFWAQVKLADSGIKGKDLKDYVFLDSRSEFVEEIDELGYEAAVSRRGWLHSTADVIEEVVEGRFDAGVTSLRAFEKHKYRGLVLIEDSEFERGFKNPIVVGKNITDSAERDFREVFTSMGGEPFLLVVPGRPSGFSAVNQEFYTIANDAVARMEGLFPLKVNAEKKRIESVGASSVETGL